MALDPLGRRVLALDLATVTGFAYGEAGDAPRTGTFRCIHVEGSSGGALAGYARWLRVILRQTRPHYVYYEAPLPAIKLGGKTNIRTLQFVQFLAGVTELVATEEGATVVPAHIDTVRKYFTGAAKATKAQVRARCWGLGWSVQTDDEADAVAVWAFGHAQLAQQERQLRANREDGR